MHAVVVKVTLKDRAAAVAALREQVVPGATAAPGFVAGYWLSHPGEKGTSIIVFESAEAAQSFANGDTPPGEAPVTLDSIEVAEVVAHA